MSDLQDILGNDPQGKLPEDKLMAYLEGRLSAEEQREVERFLSQEGFESDAVEGLKSINTADAKAAVDQLNHNLRKELLSRRSKRRRQIKDNPWALFAIGLTLLLVILAYFVIKMVTKQP